MTITTPDKLQIKLVSETTFGRGEGAAGLVDVDVHHNADTGLPYIHARTLKGLLVESCSEILFTLSKSGAANLDKWETAALFLFGIPGSTQNTDAKMKLGHAHFSKNFQAAVAASDFTPEQVLEAWTVTRTQTAADVLGVPEAGSLRSIRAVRAGTTLSASITFEDDLNDTALALLDAAVRITRRAGLGRNRGRGKIKMQLLDNGELLNRTVDFERAISEGTSA